MRVLADLEKPQLEALAQICEREGSSRAALLREAVDDLIAKKSHAGMEAAFGLWKDKVPYADGLEMQEALRAEWDDR